MIAFLLLILSIYFVHEDLPHLQGEELGKVAARAIVWSRLGFVFLAECVFWWWLFSG